MARRVLSTPCLCAAAIVMGLVFPSGCDRSSSGKKTIGVVPKGTSHVFWKSVKAGAEKAGKELGVDIKWDGPPDEKEINTQTRIIGDMINRGVDALVVAP